VLHVGALTTYTPTNGILSVQMSLPAPACKDVTYTFSLQSTKAGVPLAFLSLTAPPNATVLSANDGVTVSVLGDGTSTSFAVLGTVLSKYVKSTTFALASGKPDGCVDVAMTTADRHQQLDRTPSAGGFHPVCNYAALGFGWN
jgi:hypothetical protein